MSLLRRIAADVFKPCPVSRETAIGVGERLAAATSLTSSLEYLTQRHQLKKGGLNDWDITKDHYTTSSPLTQKLLDLLSSERVTTAVHVAEAVVSAGMLLPGKSRWRGAGSLFLSATTSLLYPRHRYGTDGSDQVSMLVQMAAGTARLSNTPQVKDAALWYIALQSNLSYVVAGWFKLVGKPWRDGSALSGVLRTKTYGSQSAFKLTRKYPRASRALTHGVLGFECLFPIAYLAGGRLARPVISSAVAFHVLNGFAMGLGRFSTAFPAMHPAVLYTAAPKSHPKVSGRDDRALALAGTALLLTASAAAMVAAQRRMRVRQPQPGARNVTTRHGNVLQYELLSQGEQDKPVLVFCNGLGSPSEYFSWITEYMTEETGYGVLIYDRAGYCGSERHCRAPFQLDEAVDDLHDLVNEAVPTGRQIVLVGHSLGGEIARRAARRLQHRTHSVVYLDSSHPAELNRSPQQSKTAPNTREYLTVMLWSLRVGAGLVMLPPRSVGSLPPKYRSTAFSQYADTCAWKSGRREWDAVMAEFETFSGALPPVETPALVVSAQQTVDRDPEQLLMHHEIAQAHRGQQRLVASTVVERAAHETLLTNAEYAIPLASRIAGFLDAAATASHNEAAKEQAK
ncbi:alpha/beta fold hydrolase [Streptomyces sp. CT34]|uniref:alpha/beta fold hydrolase n=1 Tax=Streptomyces sp. CT34 TaxID=1553907 RepID=UPI0012FF1A9C|nr:alpha/beta fold hydrolase [Streptomyces sp. CT34]